MTNFTVIYDRFLGKITDDMYIELTPSDTIKDLQSLLINAIPNFEFPRVNLYNYELKTDIINEEDIVAGDFVIGSVWQELDELTEDTPQVIVERSAFEADLTSEEVNILAILMMIGWLQR
jgi:hypothetical protein